MTSRRPLSSDPRDATARESTGASSQDGDAAPPSAAAVETIRSVLRTYAASNANLQGLLLIALHHRSGRLHRDKPHSNNNSSSSGGSPLTYYTSEFLPALLAHLTHRHRSSSSGGGAVNRFFLQAFSIVSEEQKQAYKDLTRDCGLWSSSSSSLLSSSSSLGLPLSEDRDDEGEGGHCLMDWVEHYCRTSELARHRLSLLRGMQAALTLGRGRRTEVDRLIAQLVHAPLPSVVPIRSAADASAVLANVEATPAFQYYHHHGQRGDGGDGGGPRGSGPFVPVLVLTLCDAVTGLSYCWCSCDSVEDEEDTMEEGPRRAVPFPLQKLVAPSPFLERSSRRGSAIDSVRLLLEANRLASLGGEGKASADATNGGVGQTIRPYFLDGGDNEESGERDAGSDGRDSRSPQVPASHSPRGSLSLSPSRPSSSFSLPRPVATPTARQAAARPSEMGGEELEESTQCIQRAIADAEEQLSSLEKEEAELAALLAAVSTCQDNALRERVLCFPPPSGLQWRGPHFPHINRSSTSPSETGEAEVRDAFAQRDDSSPSEDAPWRESSWVNAARMEQLRGAAAMKAAENRKLEGRLLERQRGAHEWLCTSASRRSEVERARHQHEREALLGQEHAHRCDTESQFFKQLSSIHERMLASWNKATASRPQAWGSAQQSNGSCTSPDLAAASFQRGWRWRGTTSDGSSEDPWSGACAPSPLLQALKEKVGRVQEKLQRIGREYEDSQRAVEQLEQRMIAEQAVREDQVRERRARALALSDRVRQEEELSRTLAQEGVHMLTAVLTAVPAMLMEVGAPEAMGEREAGDLSEPPAPPVSRRQPAVPQPRWEHGSAPSWSRLYISLANQAGADDEHARSFGVLVKAAKEFSRAGCEYVAVSAGCRVGHDDDAPDTPGWETVRHRERLLLRTCEAFLRDCALWEQLQKGLHAIAQREDDLRTTAHRWSVAQHRAREVAWQVEALKGALASDAVP